MTDPLNSQLESLRRWSVIVADTGDLGSMERFTPRDATTNPSLILQAAGDERYRSIVDGVIIRCGAAEGILEELFVEFGRRILDLVPGRVSTEVDARWSFDTAQTEACARRLVDLYDRAGIPRERVLIKIASTWEGIATAARLERDGIHCNLTLLFSFAQAVACADAGATLISPFVGRIYDWHLQARGVADIAREADPGVESVRRIYHYYKKFGYPTQIMGASFRKATQVIDLAGCDLLTISPALLAELAAQTGAVPRCLDPIDAASRPVERMTLDERAFRWQHNQDAMATEKLADGIRRFDADARKLEALVATRRNALPRQGGA
jgi:transaldolase